MALGIDGWLAQLEGDVRGGMDLFVECERVAADLGDEATLSLASTALGGALLAWIHRWSLVEHGASERSDALWPGTMCLARDHINPVERASDKCEHSMT